MGLTLYFILHPWDFIKKWVERQKFSHVTHYWPSFQFFYSPGKGHKKILQYMAYLHRYTYLIHPGFCVLFCFVLLFVLFCFVLPYQFCKKKYTNLSYMVSLRYKSWCWSSFAPFWNNQWITKWWAKFELECQLLIFITLIQILKSLTKTQTLKADRWRYE